LIVVTVLACLVGLSVPGGAQGASNGPASLTISPVSGPATTTITAHYWYAAQVLNGAARCPFSPIIVTWDGKAVSTLTPTIVTDQATRYCSASVSFQPPGAARQAGGHTIAGFGEKDAVHHYPVSETFTITGGTATATPTHTPTAHAATTHPATAMTTRPAATAAAPTASDSGAAAAAMPAGAATTAGSPTAPLPSASVMLTAAAARSGLLMVATATGVLLVLAGGGLLCALVLRRRRRPAATAGPVWEASPRPVRRGMDEPIWRSTES
jgi:hypothetical protein